MRADPVSMLVTFSARLGACSKRTTNFEYERSDNGVQSTTAEATISIDYMKHNLIRLIYSSIENAILEPYFHNI